MFGLIIFNKGMFWSSKQVVNSHLVIQNKIKTVKKNLYFSMYTNYLKKTLHAMIEI